MLRKVGSHLRDQWAGTLALFLVLSGGTAYAVTQIDDNSVASRHIVNDEVRSADVKANTFTPANEVHSTGRVEMNPPEHPTGTTKALVSNGTFVVKGDCTDWQGYRYAGVEIRRPNGGAWALAYTTPSGAWVDVSDEQVNYNDFNLGGTSGGTSEQKWQTREFFAVATNGETLAGTFTMGINVADSFSTTQDCVFAVSAIGR